MRVMRKIAGCSRFQATENVSDLHLRKVLEVPAVEWVLRQRRLLCLRRVVTSAPRPLLALLQDRGSNGQRMPWTAM
eukprot:15500003-Heterocapsa_arctica.AAC.1